jgi:orotidine-5'-phosphate decarboxylase
LAQAAGIAVVVDAKRGDIGSTAAQYRHAFFGGAPGLGDAAAPAPLRTDWLTVNPYLGRDNVAELLDPDPGATGTFVLVKTSNPSSGEVQDRLCLRDDGDGERRETVADAVARLVHGWGGGRTGACGLSDVGAVVGATYPDEARRLRHLMPDTVFLVPGYGAQGATAADAVAGARPDGTGVLVSSSRGIIGAWQRAADPEDWAPASRQALDAMNRDLDAARP